MKLTREALAAANYELYRRALEPEWPDLPQRKRTFHFDRVDRMVELAAKFDERSAA